MSIRQLFGSDRDPTRPLNEVINTEEALDPRSEIDEYVFIPSTREYLRTVIEGILDTGQGHSPDCLRSWISGFFGSGKSHFLKLAGALLENRPLHMPDGSVKPALEYAAIRHGLDLPWERLARDFRVKTVTVNLALAHGGGRIAQEHPLLHRLTSELNQAWGFSAVPHVAALEREIKKRKKWDAFLLAVREHAASVGETKPNGQPYEWIDPEIRDFASEAHRMLETVLPRVMPQYGNVRDYLRDREEEHPSPVSVVQLALDLAASLHPDLGRVILCVDEVALYLRGKSGGFDGDRIREIQGLAETIKDRGRSRVFLFATAQLRVDTIDAEFAGLSEYVVFLRDRFPSGGRLELQERDIDTVVRERWLKKAPDTASLTVLRQLVRNHGGLLANAARLRDENVVREAAPLTDEDAIVAYYPCLPFHIRLLQAILEALRGDRQIDQTAAQSRALLTSVRSLFLEQNGARLADAEVGKLVTFDLVYDVIRDVVRKVDSATDRWITETIATLGKCGLIPAVSVAKVIFLLQHLNKPGQRRIRVSAENVASLLYPSLGAPWELHLKDVREACEELVQEHFVADEPEEGYRFYRAEEQSFQKEIASQPVDEGKLREVLRAALLGEARGLDLDTISVRSGHKLKVDLSVHYAAATLPNPLDPPQGLAVHFLRPQAAAPPNQTKVWASHFASAPHLALWIVPGISEVEELARKALKLESAIELHVQRHGQESKTFLKREQQRLDELKEKAIPEGARKALSTGTLVHRGIDVILAGSTKKPVELFRETMKEAVDVVFEQLEEGCVILDDAGLRKVLAWRPPQSQPEAFTALKLFDTTGHPLIDRPFLKELTLSLQGRPEAERTGKAILERFARAPFGWPERAVKAGIGALLRARRLAVRLSDGTVLRSETDPKAESWLTSTQQFARSILELSDLNVTQEERLLLQNLFATAFERAGLDTVEKLEREGPVLAAEVLAEAREAIADLAGRDLPGTSPLQQLVVLLESGLEPELAAGKLKAMATHVRNLAVAGADPVRIVEEAVRLVRTVGRLRSQGKLAPLAQARVRALHLYPTWRNRAVAVPANVVAAAESLRGRTDTPALFLEIQQALSEDATCFHSYASDYKAKHDARREVLASALGNVEAHQCWQSAPSELQEQIRSSFRAYECGVDGTLTIQTTPDGHCPGCHATFEALLDHLELIDIRERRAVEKLENLRKPGLPASTRKSIPPVTMRVSAESDLPELFDQIRASVKTALGNPKIIRVTFEEPGS